VKYLYTIFFLTLSFNGYCAVSADTIRLTLPQVVEMAKGNSIAAKQASTTRETKYWQWRTYKSNYQPQLSLSGNLPGYSKTSTPVIQPNGSILFQSINYDNSALTLNFSQTITATGATIYGMTQLQRFDNFNGNMVQYNGVPYAIGLTQPLGQYNSLKWDNRIQPLLYNESKQAYIQAQEQISISVTGYFFDLLLAQVNLGTAVANFTNTAKMLKIANLKFGLGKVSKNEILQLQLENINAKKAEGTARRDVEIATLNLRSYIGLEGDDKIELIVPETISRMAVSADKVLAQAYENRSDAIAFVRRIAEAQRDVAIAHGQTGLTATLTANLGTSNTSSSIPGIYRSPQTQQLLELQFSIPVLDWGRSKAKIKTAEANQQLTVDSVERDKQTFKQQIVTQVSLFNEMKEQLGYTAEADSIASEKYKIARERYVLGDLSITDLSIAFTENDQAKRDYVQSLRDFWSAYYELRYLSLYDFETNEKITYK